MTTRRRWVVTDRFRASGSDGRIYRVTETTQELQFGMLDGTTQTARGLKAYRLDDGHSVNVLTDGRLEVVGRGVTLTRQ